MYGEDQGADYPAIGVDDQPIGAWLRRRARLDQQSDHVAFIFPPRPVKWVNARALRLEIRGPGGYLASPNGTNRPGMDMMIISREHSAIRSQLEKR